MRGENRHSAQHPTGLSDSGGAGAAPAIEELHILWITAGLGCDGDTIAVTGASQPSLEDVLMGGIPGIPKVTLHNQFLAYENGDDFLQPFRLAAAGALGPFILVVEGSIPDETIKLEGYWAALGTDAATGQPITTCEWIDRLAPQAWAVMAAGTCATYGGIHAMEGNPTGAMGLPDYLGWSWASGAGIPVVCVPGCPVQPDNFMGTLLYLLHQASGCAPMIPLDDCLRPRWLFGQTVHEGCDRAGYYEQGDFGAAYGSPKCIVKLGCWGPVVRCNVGKRGWMNGVGGCPNVGGICIGCTMPGFPDKFMPFMDEPPGAKLSSSAVLMYGRTVRALRTFTMGSLDQEPDWRRSGSAPSPAQESLAVPLRAVMAADPPIGPEEALVPPERSAEAAGDQPAPEPDPAQAILREMAQVFSRVAAQPRGNGAAPPQPATEAATPVGDAIGVVAVDGLGIVRSFNAGAEQIFGYGASEVIGLPIERLVNAGDAAAAPAAATALRADGRDGPGSASRGLVGTRRDGVRFPIESTSAEVECGSERLRVLALRDVAAHDLGEARRRKTDARYRSLVEQIPAVTFIGALAGDEVELYVNPQIQALLGFSQAEWLSDPFLWFRQLHPADRELCNREFARGCRTGGPFRAEFRALTRDGEVVWVRGEARVVRDDDGRPLFIQGVAYDITESKRAEEALRANAEQIRASLAEKEVLLREIHHRVKNNLQVISSLLKLQSGHVQDRSALELFNDSRNRIRSMALVHEKLYQSDNLSRVDFNEYVRSLTGLLFRSYGARIAPVTLKTVVQNVYLTINVAVPLGLIINELISNSLKYAFPNDRSGEVRLELRPSQHEGNELIVADDGIGFPSDVDFHKTETLGMQLVRALTQQIGGRIELRAETGTEFRILFPG